MFSFILVVCLAGLFCLTPLTLYLLWLSVLTRRDRPTVLTGTWDFTALLGGLSGFLLFGGGLLLSLLQSNVRFFMRGNLEALRDAWGKEHLAWYLTVSVYLLLVGGCSVLAFLSRKRTLVVYNVDPGQFEATLSEVFEHIGRPIERRGNLWVGGVPLCEVDPFDAGRTIMLRWVSEDLLLYQELERHLREAVSALPSSNNPAARWLMTGVVGSTVAVVFCISLLIYGLDFFRR